jgi:cytochrome b561
MDTPKRYHPLLVALHWISAILIIGNLLFGTFWLKIQPNDSAKIPSFIVHIVLGLIILVLTIVRFGVRLGTKKPAPVTAGNRFLDAVGVATHWLLYLGAFGMGVSGLVAALQAHLFQSVFLGRGEIPIDLYVFAPRVWHGYLALAMYAIIALHVGAALFHLVVRRENLLARMWFGRK